VRFGRKCCLWKAPEAGMEGAEVQGRFLLKLYTLGISFSLSFLG
jgi:hypothetical protein